MLTSVTIDLSTPKLEDEDWNTLRRGSFNDLLNSDSDDNGKILNALSISLTQPPLLEGGLDTNGRALQLARTDPLMLTVKENPTEGMAWALAATKGAYSRWHIDTDGFATHLDVTTGSKLWIVARPVDGDAYGSVTFSVDELDPHYVIPSDDHDKYIVEAVLLRQGDLL